MGPGVAATVAIELSSHGRILQAAISIAGLGFFIARFIWQYVMRPMAYFNF